jgi:hypothetical protein
MTKPNESGYARPTSSNRLGSTILEWAARWARLRQKPLTGPVPSEMSDKCLQQTIHDVGGRLLNSLAPLVQHTFADDAHSESVPFVKSMPTSVRGHVLMLFMQAYDSFGLVLRSLNYQAHAAALGPIRSVAETLAFEKWLLESDNAGVRLARSYRLILDAADQLDIQRRALERVAVDSPERRNLSSILFDTEQELRQVATDLATRNGVEIAKPHGSPSKLMERFLSEYGGYLLYSLLSSAGVHSGVMRNKFFYGKPDTGILDFDFKGMFIARAYWIGVAIDLYLDLCDLVAETLGWHNWHGLSKEAHSQLEPLYKEATKRFFQPLLDTMPAQSASPF